MKKHIGYQWNGMEQISFEKAISMYGTHTVYKLYDDNTEAEAESLHDIIRHYHNGGAFGVER